MFNFGSPMEWIKNIITGGAATAMDEKKFLELEIAAFKKSEARKEMLSGEKYYDNEHDIKDRKRMVVGDNGDLVEVKNLPNNKIIDNQYAKLVDQKVNYLLGKPITVKSDNEAYSKLLKKIMNKNFMRQMKTVGRSSLNGGISWLHPYYDDQGQFRFKKFSAHEILPFWKDEEHTILEAAVRIYTVAAYEGTAEKQIEKVEVYDINGVHRFEMKNGSLIPDVENPSTPYVKAIKEDGTEEPLNWERVPMIAFKYNDKEIPLIRRVKSLQDGINIIYSDFMNNMQEDSRNTILILENYDGENLGEFRRNLATYGAVKVKTIEGQSGNVRTLQIEVNSENYKVIYELLKKAIIENGRGYDAKDDRMSGNPNQMNIQSMYSDIDLDANGMETEFQASLEELLWFINVHLANTGNGDFETEEVEFIFNRDILINETESITNCKNSLGVLSTETILKQHPWVDDPAEELKRLEAQNEAEADAYDTKMPNGSGSGGDISAKQ